MTYGVLEHSTKSRRKLMAFILNRYFAREAEISYESINVRAKRIANCVVLLFSCLDPDATDRRRIPQ
jgi:hypothetical protein